MGLYLCVFENDHELDGVEVGSYADFNFFRDVIVEFVEYGVRGSKCPVLTLHHDSDGVWSAKEAESLLLELDVIESVLRQQPPLEFDSPWKKGIAKTTGLMPRNLLECFFDIDGEPLVERLRGLGNVSVEHRVPILFQ